MVGRNDRNERGTYDCGDFNRRENLVIFKKK